MLDLSDIHEEESFHEEHVEADDGEMITESGGSSSCQLQMLVIRKMVSMI